MNGDPNKNPRMWVNGVEVPVLFGPDNVNVLKIEMSNDGPSIAPVHISPTKDKIRIHYHKEGPGVRLIWENPEERYAEDVMLEIVQTPLRG